MKKLLVAMVVAFGLTGCAQLQDLSGTISILSSSHQNITKEQLKIIEDGATLVFAGLNVYRKSCVRGAIPPSCREVIAAIQVYTRQLPPILRELRAFVRENDQVNAVKVYAELQRVFNLVRAQASANGIIIGG